MQTYTIVDLADAFALAAHSAVQQVRKYTNEPYIIHPREVRELLLKYSTNIVTPHMEAAALLHDVVEDCNITLEQIQSVFGVEITALVSDLTDVSVPSDSNRRARKTKDLAHTASASIGAKTIKIADLISNTKSIVQYDQNFARVYLREKSDILAACGDADPGLLAAAYQSIREAKAIINL